MDSRLLIEKINGPFLYELKGAPGGIQGGPRSRASQRLARDAQERNLSCGSPRQARSCSLVYRTSPRPWELCAARPGFVMPSSTGRFSVCEKDTFLQQ